MKKHLIAICTTILCCAQVVSAQQSISNQDIQGPCGSPVPDDRWEQAFSEYVHQFKTNQNAEKSQSQLYTIPVIVHVLHSGQSVGTFPNLAQGQINSQIRALNEDYGAVGFNKSNYPISAFTAYAINQSLSPNNLDGLGRVRIANCQVQFCLATKDTLGNLLPEPGIERINYVSKGWTNPASFGTPTGLINYMNGTIKPASIWNVSKYLNIWISDVSSASGLLGFATFPPFANLSGLNIGSNGTAQTDGVWCWARSFGSAGTYPSGAYASGYNRGRTCTHEVGHWLGLRHIWGDGTCLSDFCDDTPMASASNFGSPVYPYKTANCSGNNPNGEMFMNFMDYTNDPVKYMFTPDQATRIQTAMQFSPYRNQLGTHNLCTVTQVPAFAQFNIPAVACANDVINLVNSSYGTPVPNYTWSVNGPASINPSPNSDPATITFPFGGTYTITLAADNGTLSTFSKTISITPSPTLNILGASPVVCMNDDIVLIAGGAVNYTWQPGNLFGNTFAYTATSDQTISLTGSDGTCKSTWDFTISVTECAGLQGASQEDLILDIYPNPASEQFYIRYGKSFTSLELSDISGRTVLSKALNCATGACTEEISTNEMKNGIYIMQLRAKDGSRTARKFVVEN